MCQTFKVKKKKQIRRSQLQRLENSSRLLCPFIFVFYFYFFQNSRSLLLFALLLSSSFSFSSSKRDKLVVRLPVSVTRSCSLLYVCVLVVVVFQLKSHVCLCLSVCTTLLLRKQNKRSAGKKADFVIAFYLILLFFTYVMCMSSFAFFLAHSFRSRFRDFVSTCPSYQTVYWIYRYWYILVCVCALIWNCVSIPIFSST